MTAPTRSKLGSVLGGIRSLVLFGFRVTVSSARTMFASVPRPSALMTEPWRVSIATLVSSHPKVPFIARRLLRRFDKFGSVTIGPTAVGFDDKTIRWTRIIEIHAYPTANLIPPSVVIERESDRVREMLPPIPGRRWIVRKVANAAVTVMTAFTPHPQSSADTMPLLPCEIVYRNMFGRPSRLSAGLFAATALTLIPEATDSLLTMAADRGIPVQAIPDKIGEMRAARSDSVRQFAGYATGRVRMT